MKVLFPVNEAYPLYKIGGLGDVGSSLPKALTKEGIDVRIALPKHPEIKPQESWVTVEEFEIIYDKQRLPVTVFLTHLKDPKVPIYLFGEEKYLSQHTDASDNHADKYAVFALAISTWLNKTTYWQPNIIHLHDWHVSLIPTLLKHKYHQDHYKYITNIHNLAYQGDTSTPVVPKLGLVPGDCRILDWDGGDNHTNFLLEGILHSDLVVAVSPTYAHEILTPEYGEDIDQELQGKKDSIIGIINGIDTDVFDPSQDPHIYKNYSSADYAEGKKENKFQLQKELDLKQDANTLMVGFVGRVDPGQKGCQLIIKALEDNQIVTKDQQFVFLGTGDPKLEKGLHQAGDNKPNIKIFTRYDEPLAAKIYAASDLLIIPSKYEPCGLVQLIAMRYGGLPVARRTGGLADTIDHQKDGFLFDEYTVEDFIDALDKAKKYIQNTQLKNDMIEAAMTKDFSWDKPAKEYISYYKKLLLEEDLHQQ